MRLQIFALAYNLEAAVLDIDLKGQPVYPLAEALISRCIPVWRA